VKYYTCFYESFPGYARMLEPPFRVVRREPGAGALVEFGEDGAAALWEALAATGRSCGYFYDGKCQSCKISAAGMEPADKLKPGRNREAKRRLKRMAGWTAADKAVCENVTEPAVIPDGRVPWFWRYKRFVAVKPGREHPFRYSLRSPKGAGEYPLVICLHSAGGLGVNGVEAVREAPGLLCRKCHVLVPQTGWGNPYSGETSEELGEVIESIPHVDPSRIYIVGTSMGGCGAIIECRRHPGRYAACVTGVAWLQNLESPGKDADKYERPLDDEAYDALAQTPLWLGYGRDEKQVSEPLYAALQARGGEVKRTYLKRLGHGSAGGVFWLTRPWAKWMFGHRKAAGE
jgi:pimeloyl-ACP methyl ester carboxylesterase